MSKQSPTSRSLQEMRKRGCELVQVVEHYNSFCKIRVDLFTIVDILCVKGGKTIAVQSTSGDNVSKRVDKMKASKALPFLQKAGWIILVHGWSKKGPRGKRKIWTLREVNLSKATSDLLEGL